MVVWKSHDPSPPDDVKRLLHVRLAAVVDEHFEFEHYVDDNMRNIPDHYHAHAAARGEGSSAMGSRDGCADDRDALCGSQSVHRGDVSSSRLGVSRGG